MPLVNVDTMDQKEILEHYEKWPRLKCTSCGEEFGGFPDQVNSICKFCATRGPDGRIVEPQGTLQKLDPFDLHPEKFAEFAK
jgi:hypothetical protein